MLKIKLVKSRRNTIYTKKWLESITIHVDCHVKTKYTDSHALNQTENNALFRA